MYIINDKSTLPIDATQRDLDRAAIASYDRLADATNPYMCANLTVFPSNAENRDFRASRAP